MFYNNGLGTTLRKDREEKQHHKDDFKIESAGTSHKMKTKNNTAV